MSHTASLVVSIDLARMNDPRAVDRVLGMADRLGQRLTICVGISSAPALMKKLGSGTRHELALAADDEWSARVTPRAELSRALATADAFCRRMAWNPTTLATNELPAPEHLDLLVRRAFTAIRTPGADQPHRARSWWANPIPEAPIGLRWGLWHIPATTDLSSLSSRAVEKLLAAATHGQVVHWAIEWGRGLSPMRELAGIERVFETAAKLARERVVRSATMGDLAQRLTRPNATISARSVLRAA